MREVYSYDMGFEVVNTKSTMTRCLVDGYRPTGGRFRLSGLLCGE